MLGGPFIIPRGLMLLESVTELARTGEINRLWFNTGISMFFCLHASYGHRIHVTNRANIKIEDRKKVKKAIGF
jgi:hypothetical protein